LFEQHDKALEYQLKAYFMHDKSGKPDQYAHSSIELGRYYAAAKDYKGAENTLNKIIKFANEQGGYYYEAQGYYVLAQVKAAAGDMQSANNLIEKAREIAKSTKDEDLDEEITRETIALIK
jgi:tetratricopeptide (TPR) repeat protein